MAEYIVHMLIDECMWYRWCMENGQMQYANTLNCFEYVRVATDVDDEDKAGIFTVSE